MLGPWKSTAWFSIMTSSQIQDGGRPIIWKSLCGHISVKSDPIITKFGALNHIATMIKRFDQNTNFKYKIADGCHIVKHRFRDKSAADCPIFKEILYKYAKSESNDRRMWKFSKIWKVVISIKFCVLKQTRTITTRKPSCRWQTRATRKHAKNCSNSTCLQLRCRWQYFSHLAVVASDICEIPTNSLKVQTYRVQGHPRSSILVSIESSHTTFY